MKNEGRKQKQKTVVCIQDCCKSKTDDLSVRAVIFLNLTNLSTGLEKEELTARCAKIAESVKSDSTRNKNHPTLPHPKFNVRARAGVLNVGVYYGTTSRLYSPQPLPQHFTRRESKKTRST